jgi:DnaJ-class molecular chaperone
MEYRKSIITRTGQRTWENKYYDVCGECSGSGLSILRIPGGKSTAVQCRLCKGTGDVQVTKKIEVIVEPII